MRIIENLKVNFFTNTFDRVEHRKSYWEREKEIMYHKMILVLVTSIFLMSILKIF